MNEGRLSFEKQPKNIGEREDVKDSIECIQLVGVRGNLSRDVITPEEGGSKQRLIEIEEKRKKRRDRKEQQHFRGSSFGQGSTQRVAEVVKAYEYGPQGFSLEESQDNHLMNEFMTPGINFLKDKINVALHESSEIDFQNKDLAETQDSYRGLLS